MDDSEQDEEDSSDRNIPKDVFTPENNAILEVRSPARVDESISHVEVHAHLPFASATFNANDEIRIVAINKICALYRHKVACTLPDVLLKPMVRLLRRPNSSTMPFVSCLRNYATSSMGLKSTDVATWDSPRS